MELNGGQIKRERETENGNEGRSGYEDILQS